MVGVSTLIQTVSRKIDPEETTRPTFAPPREIPVGNVDGDLVCIGPTWMSQEVRING